MNKKRPLRMCTVSANAWEAYQRVALSALDYLRATKNEELLKSSVSARIRAADARSFLRNAIDNLWPETKQ